LDHREKGGYTQHKALFYTDEDQSGHEVVVYVGQTSHRQYAGPASPQKIAQTLLTSVGPSGPNIDYLLNLADAIRKMGKHDEHVFQLEKIVLGLKNFPNDIKPFTW